MWNVLLGLQTSTTIDRTENSATARACAGFSQIFRRTESKSPSLFDSAIDLMTAFQDAGDSDRASDVGQEIESAAVDTFGYDDVRTIGILINIGLCHQKNYDWERARPVFEHALTSAMALMGMDSEVTLVLERGLESGHCELSGLDRSIFSENEGAKKTKCRRG